MLSIAFIDTLGLCYDGSTLTKRGLGGSESAVILISKELAKLGFDVTVFNDCTHDDASPGIYDNVKYRPIHEVENVSETYDVVIGSRSVAAFAPREIKDRFKTFTNIPDFTNIQKNSRHKVLWMHDTFCDGDDLIDTFLLDGHINEIFVLSDFHLDYVTNCDHGKRRMFEVMKKYMFVTRNGVTKYHDWVDISKKDPNHFVYNSSVTKGMRPLVNKIWPRIRAHIPEAKLTIIGGYYRMRSGLEPDQQEIEWRQLVDSNPDINFTGIIKQSEIAGILSNASYMIYPCDFPETFGISTLESLTYNTPVITCDFGALEETAFDNACYKIPFPVVANGLFPYINEDEQVEKFVQMTLSAHRDKYLHQQKMYACNSIKNICGWDSVALQWKQHFYKKLGEYLSADDYRKAQHINYKVRKAFGRRFTNEEELQEPRGSQRDIVIISPVYNAEQYIEKCINSVACQDYDNYTMYIIDDCSTDNTVDNIFRCISNLPANIQNKFNVIRNDVNIGAVYNQVNTIRENCKSGDIIMLLDGDDWLVNDPNIFHKYNNIYSTGTEFTYGSCWSVVDNIPLIAQPYPPEVKANKSYREYMFNWNMPYTHLRTFLADLLFSINQEDILVNGTWPRAGGDASLFYALLEKADPNLVACISEVVYNYNDGNPLNDYKVNADEQNRTANAVISKGKVRNKFTVTIPTMWRAPDLTLRLLQDLESCDLVDEVILVDNDPERKQTLDATIQEKVFNKVKYVTSGENIGVNPAWNLGASLARNSLLCFCNDDIVFDTNLFNILEPRITPSEGAFGIINNDPEVGQPPKQDGPVEILKWHDGDCIHCFGQLFFIHKDNWKDIPSELVISFGDDVIFHEQLRSGRNNYLISNLNFETRSGSTRFDQSVKLLQLDQWNKEQAFFDNWWEQNHIDSPKFTVTIPTMWECNDVFIRALQSYIDCPLVNDIIIIDNNRMNRPNWMCLDNPKVRVLTQEQNIFVNPAWNLGVKEAKNDLICIANDDIEFDIKVFGRITPTLQDPNTGVMGLCPGNEQFGQVPITDKSIDIVQWQPGMHQFGFGCLMFVNKKTWTNIPDSVKIYYGDYFIFDNHLAHGRINYMICNMDHYTPYAQTTVKMYIDNADKMSTLQEQEGNAYNEIKQHLFEPKQEVISVEPLREKAILIAIPTNKNVETATFKSIYDLKIPKGYRADLQFFYGYQIDQVRNLIADWGKHYDYLFCVDSDIVLPRDALLKLVGWDKDIISGLYIQRIHDRHTLELYENRNGDIVNIPWENIKQRLGLLEIAACGFGCVLIRGEVLRKMEYPHFVYKSAIDHAHTLSEDVYFCTKAKEAGFSTWCDTTVLCEHIGQYTFKVDEQQPKAVIEYIRDEDRLPKEQIEYLHSISNINPKVVYDIGACVLHWERHAKQAWPNAQFVLFDGEPGVERILMESGHPYHIGVLTDVDGKEIDFYHHLENPGGNSYYKEITPGWEQHKTKKIGYTLDSVVKYNNFPLPDLIKLDVQGAEIDVLKGATKCIEHCTDIILEAQHKTYNEGAPHVDDVINFMDSIGFDLVKNINKVEYDGDYHFKKRVNARADVTQPEKNVAVTNNNSYGPTQAFIIQTVNDAMSAHYAQTAIESCKQCGIKPNVWLGPNSKEDWSIARLSQTTGVRFGDMDIGAACASASHFTLWMHIAEMKTNDPIIILEHDAILLHPIRAVAPINWDNRIIALGYKTKNPKDYDYVKAGPPTNIIPRSRHSGAHAYMITPNTARKLLEELHQLGAPRAVDNFYFMRVNDPGDTESSVPLCITDPISAIGWIRESTIWKDPSTLNYDCLPSYTENLKGN